jgi:calcineurin-like phosphoesterase family protein
MKLILKEGQELFFTSDTHFNHKNICRGVTSWSGNIDKTRDFSDLESMNSAIIDNINRKVGQEDVLIHLGDFSFGGYQHIPEFRHRIVCQNVILVLGNHDKHIRTNTDGYQSLFSSVHDYLEISVRPYSTKMVKHLDYEFVLSHFPIASWNNMKDGSMHLHGHVHLPKDRKLGPGKMMDVGVDGNDYAPYSLREVLSVLKDRPIKSLLEYDHHER